VTPLIPRATPLEAALERATAARLALPAQILATTNDPWTCPADQLGLLAWSLSLELWDDRWPELKKRQVCADAFRLHRLKTTLAGIRAHVALVDAEVRGAVRPPARAFWRSAITDVAREAQLAALPQIRLYPFAHHTTALRRWFLSSRAARRSYHGHAWLRASRGAELLGTRATYWQAGVERPIDIVEEAGEIRAFLPAVRPNGIWYGHGAASGFLRSSRGAASVVAFRPDPARAAFALTRGADAVSIAPTRVFARRVAPRHRSFVGRRLRFLQSTAAPLLVYDRYSIADPSVGIVRRRTRSWHGHMRFGIRPFTAELQVAVPMVRSHLTFDRWHGRGFLRTADQAPLARAVEAVRVSKAARDTILLDTASHGPATFRAGARFGDPSFSAFGDRMRNF
jgi:phage tail P2-like protein